MTNTTTKSQIQILRDALTDERAWLEAQRKAISKGCGSSWDMGQCDERMDLIDEALRLTEGAQDAPGEAMARDPDWWQEMLAAVMREFPRNMGRHKDGNAPGHCHSVPGIWDSDNGAKAGTVCAWCLVWNKAASELAAHPAPTPTAEVMGGAFACSACYGTGYGVDSKPCPCGCRPPGPKTSTEPAMICPRCGVDRLKTSCAMTVCSLVGESRAKSGQQQAGVPDAIGVKPSHEQAMRGYAVACKFGVFENQAFTLADEMFTAFQSAPEATP